ncbi:uncharacterized protein A1O5_08701 [Cladophialophora psammophila CBS 110553]|uniref:Uncharacterized protein n=1 Tax=Cladophialophora psammophila CBS 110553 TaxID=1182543 RepID=W9WTV2_9EURO|nr:uncharacterized protein A1O5_08701 [Cladophialophora psammophila CBS 110553]EXJ68086.1 hypothetical protein A1O5_08701 [Cladophialophora psammophila CBS 110553]
MTAPSTDDVPTTGDGSVREDVVEDDLREEVKELVYGVLEDVMPKAADDEDVKAKEGDELEETKDEVAGADEVEGGIRELESSLDVEEYDVAVYCALEVDESPTVEELAVADSAAAETAEAAEDRIELTSVKTE